MLKIVSSFLFLWGLDTKEAWLSIYDNLVTIALGIFMCLVASVAVLLMFANINTVLS